MYTIRGFIIEINLIFFIFFILFYLFRQKRVFPIFSKNMQKMWWWFEFKFLCFFVHLYVHINNSNNRRTILFIIQQQQQHQWFTICSCFSSFFFSNFLKFQFVFFSECVYHKSSWNHLQEDEMYYEENQNLRNFKYK